MTIGDHCTLGDQSLIQCHSLEDGSFKSDRIVIGHGCTVGAKAFVHYDVELGDGGLWRLFQDLATAAWFLDARYD